MISFTKLFSQASFTPESWGAAMIAVCSAGLQGKNTFPNKAGLTSLNIHGSPDAAFIIVHSYILPDTDNTQVLQTHNDLITIINKILKPL